MESFPNFGFAFNDKNFSDRTLDIHVIPDEDNIDPQPLSLKTIHISSSILAGNSPFFHKMFCNGMRESEQRHAILRIVASEEEPLMDVLKFMYSGSLSATTPHALLDVLMAADKYDVAFCVRYCTKMLLELPMTCEFASFCLNMDDPSSSTSVSYGEAVEALKDSAEQFLALTNIDLRKMHDEVRLIGPLLRFLYRTVEKLKGVFVKNVELPVKVVYFEAPHLQCIAYLELKRDTCLALAPSQKVYSQPFQLYGLTFRLLVKRVRVARRVRIGMNVHVTLREKEIIGLSSNLELAVREKPTEKYVTKFQGRHTLSGIKPLELFGFNDCNMYDMPWTVGEDILHFINGTFYIRLDLTLTQKRN